MLNEEDVLSLSTYKREISSRGEDHPVLQSSSSAQSAGCTRGIVDVWPLSAVECAFMAA